MLEFIELCGITTAFEVTGNGPPLLMLHGAEGSHRQFSGILPELTNHYTVITYDQRDCGETVSPDYPATLTALADDAQALLEALGYASVFVFGTSFGGRVAQALAVRHAPIVQRLILASTWPLAVSLVEARGEAMQEFARLRSNLPASAEQFVEYFFPPSFLDDYPAYRGHFKLAPARSARSDRRAAAVGDIPDLDISSIKQPTLLIAGDVDRLVPAELTLSLAQFIQDTRSVVLPGVGHLSLAQAPKIVAQHLRNFLA